MIPGASFEGSWRHVEFLTRKIVDERDDVIIIVTIPVYTEKFEIAGKRVYTNPVVEENNPEKLNAKVSIPEKIVKAVYRVTSVELTAEPENDEVRRQTEF
jgi:Tfp pilus assembly protein PilZ